jgi:hypothetical protein
LTAVAGLVLLVAARAPAQVSPAGGELQLNSYTTGEQHQPSIALGASGTIVVTWNSYGSYGDDDSYSSVQVRRFGGDGGALGGEVQVNTYTTDGQGAPAIATDPLGNFVVVWESVGSDGGDTSQTSIQARLFDAGGTPVGPQFQVNTFTNSYQGSPKVAADDVGNFVVVWESFGSPGNDASEWSIQGQRFDETGLPLGAQFQVNGYTTDRQIHPGVAVDSAGNFVVVWSSFGSPGNDNLANSIQARLFDAAGTPSGAQFQVNGYTTGYQFNPAVAADADGNFVVVWGSVGSYGTDTSSSSIQGRRYDGGGAPLDVQFQVNTYTTYNQHQPALALDARGHFVVAWQSEGSDGSDTDAYSIHLQRYRADGTALDGQVQVNTYTTGYQNLPAVAADELGNLLLAWASDGSSGTDTDASSVLGQRYDGLFRDGFESGDTGRWSLTLP